MDDIANNPRIAGIPLIPSTNYNYYLIIDSY